MEGFNLTEERRKEQRIKIQNIVDIIASSLILDILREAEELKCDERELFGATMRVLPQMFAETMLPYNSDSKKHSGFRTR